MADPGWVAAKESIRHTCPACPHGFRCGDQQRLDLSDQRDSRFDRAAPDGQEQTDLLDDAVASLRQREGLWFSQCLARRRVGIDGVRFPVSPRGSPGPDDLSDLDDFGHQVPSQAGSIGVGPLDLQFGLSSLTRTFLDQRAVRRSGAGRQDVDEFENRLV